VGLPSQRDLCKCIEPGCACGKPRPTGPTRVAVAYETEGGDKATALSAILARPKAEALLGYYQGTGHWAWLVDE
jgi:hypothetical protein